MAEQRRLDAEDGVDVEVPDLHDPIPEQAPSSPASEHSAVPPPGQETGTSSQPSLTNPSSSTDPDMPEFDQSSYAPTPGNDMIMIVLQLLASLRVVFVILDAKNAFCTISREECLKEYQPTNIIAKYTHKHDWLAG